MASSVELKRIVKTYQPGGEPTVKGVDLTIAQGEFFILLGPSGCGKSTLLRMVAGLEEITSGELLIGDKLVNQVAPKDRDIAMVFQSYALYPHLTVRENLGFGLRMRRVPAAEIERRILPVAESLGLGHLLERLPKELSGGQRQRVALGRAIVREPQVFLLDEPLSNLDAKLRGAMRVELKRLHQRLAATMIYVTHDQVEAMTLGDRVAVLHDGKLQQVGTPLEVYDQPTNRFVAGFLGSPPMNFLPGQLEGEAVTLGKGRVPLPARFAGAAKDGTRVDLGFRPEDVTLEPPGDDHPLTGTVAVLEPLGAETVVTIDGAEGVTLVARVLPDRAPAQGERVGLRLDPERIHLFRSEDGARLGPAPAPRRALPQQAASAPPAAQAETTDGSPAADEVPA